MKEKRYTLFVLQAQIMEKLLVATLLPLVLNADILGEEKAMNGIQ
tara:strand:+ start:510 stop:644 length:135 start_codon:yes stop_codon:yes gene_type:complete